MEEVIRHYGPWIGLIGGLTGLWTWAVNEWQRRPNLAVEIRTDPGWSYVETTRSGAYAVLTAIISNRSSVPNAVLKYELATRKRDSAEFDWFAIEQGEMTVIEDGKETIREIGIVPLNMPARTASNSHLWIAIRAADYPDSIVFDLRITDMWGNTYSSSGKAAIKKNRIVGRLRPGETSVEP